MFRVAQMFEMFEICLRRLGFLGRYLSLAFSTILPLFTFRLPSLFQFLRSDNGCQQ
jgi:hypothetical protein